MEGNAVRIIARPFLLIVPFMFTVVVPAASPAKPPHSQTTGHGAHWSYDGAEGPSHWADLDPAYAACATGRRQSPIDLAKATSKDLKDPELHYQSSELRELNNGHTVQVNYDKGSYMELNGQRYELVQFHYHVPSEHHVNGKAFAAELHLVHKTARDQLAVIAILFEEGAENSAYQAFLNDLPDHESKEVAKGVKINVAELLPPTRATFRYDGSLTTPPCTEGVSWLVMTSPVKLSHAQIARLEKVFKRNNRPVQPLNGRTVTEDDTP